MHGGGGLNMGGGGGDSTAGAGGVPEETRRVPLSTAAGFASTPAALAGGIRLAAAYAPAAECLMGT